MEQPPLPFPAYRLKQLTVLRAWGIWDDTGDTWYEGDQRHHEDAQHPAGIPAWKREKDAQRALEGLR